jgi:hypothetical protein
MGQRAESSSERDSETAKLMERPSKEIDHVQESAATHPQKLRRARASGPSHTVRIQELFPRAERSSIKRHAAECTGVTLYFAGTRPQTTAFQLSFPFFSFHGLASSGRNRDDNAQ